jgi:phosphatidylglycerophosphatase A
MAQGGTTPEDTLPQPTGTASGTTGPINRSFSDRICLFVATVGGIGWLRPGPGTWGSLAGTVVAYVWRNGWDGTGIAGTEPLSLFGRGVAVAVVLVCALVCVPVCTRAGKILGRVDPGCIVIDEFLAMLLILALPERVDLLTAGIGFALFRLFDIAKPWPVSAGERLPAGWGVMADDLIAAVLAAAGMFAVRWVVG